jgi:hydrogenase expression/formation protein HypC
MSEPKGRGAAWTEERGTSDEGPPPQAARPARARLESGPEASECSSGACITCSDTAVQVTVVRLLADQMAVVDTDAGEETVSVALVTAGVGDTILVHAREAIAVVGPGHE